MGQHGLPAGVFTPYVLRAAGGAAASEEVVAMSEERTPHEYEALAEIELYGELIIAAAAEPDERLSRARIDEVLLAPDRPGGPDL